MLTQSEADSAQEAEEQQHPKLLKALFNAAEAAGLGQLLPYLQPAGQVHPERQRPNHHEALLQTFTCPVCQQRAPKNL